MINIVVHVIIGILFAACVTKDITFLGIFLSE